MKRLVLGVIGHVDHGKTALVRALTGMDTDRLPEEKRRGISIALGFAHLRAGPETEIDLIDMPGHERFVRTMIGGVHGDRRGAAGRRRQRGHQAADGRARGHRRAAGHPPGRDRGQQGGSGDAGRGGADRPSGRDAAGGGRACSCGRAGADVGACTATGSRRSARRCCARGRGARCRRMASCSCRSTASFSVAGHGTVVTGTLRGARAGAGRRAGAAARRRAGPGARRAGAWQPGGRRADPASAWRSICATSRPAQVPRGAALAQPGHAAALRRGSASSSARSPTRRRCAPRPSCGCCSGPPSSTRGCACSTATCWNPARPRWRSCIARPRSRSRRAST